MKYKGCAVSVITVSRVRADARPDCCSLAREMMSMMKDRVVGYLILSKLTSNPSTNSGSFYLYSDLSFTVSFSSRIVYRN